MYVTLSQQAQAFLTSWGVFDNSSHVIKKLKESVLVQDLPETPLGLVKWKKKKIPPKLFQNHFGKE